MVELAEAVSHFDVAHPLEEVVYVRVGIGGRDLGWVFGSRMSPNSWVWLSACVCVCGIADATQSLNSKYRSCTSSISKFRVCLLVNCWGLEFHKNEMREVTT